VIGAYLLNQDVDLRRTYTYLDQAFVSEYRVDRYALYAEASLPLGERTRFTIGLRGERHEARYADSEDIRFDPDDTMAGGRAVLQHDLSEATMAYASVTRGYKAGGFNISGTLEPSLREYDPESLWNYELGVKGLYLDGRLDVRAALFSMQRDDVQVGTSIQVSRPDGSVEFIDLLDNAAEGVNRGLELEINYQPIEQVTLFASLGLLDTEFKDFVNVSGEDLDGEAQAHAPDYQFYAGAEYRPLPGWFVRVEAEGQDAFYYSNSRRLVDDPSDVRSESYTLWHASAGYEAARWSVKLWGRNLGDEDYTVRGFYFGNDPRDLYTERGFFQLGEPRRYGVTFTWEP
jgi:outer membrane receptor protein involved in Fe transport